MPVLAVKDRQLLRRMPAVALFATIAVGLVAAPSRGDLSSSYQAGQQHAKSLQSRIASDNGRIRAFEGTIGALQARLGQLESAVETQEQQLTDVRGQLQEARTRLLSLQDQYTRDKRVLATQLLRNYESPQPNVVDVVLSSGGFQELLNRLGDLRTLERANAATVKLVSSERAAVAGQARRLAAVEAQRQRSTDAIVDERDQVARVRLSIVDKELPLARDRAAQRGRLERLQGELTHEARALDQQAAREGSVDGGVAPPSGGCVNTPFAAHGGEYGLFLASGTNYTVNQEPVIAARLDALGRALHLHLIGISGYRTPQHSVEVGGFADDPHTHGEASDTPGIEGVPEATLEEYCLTRPFPGAAEADHIQEL